MAGGGTGGAQVGLARIGTRQHYFGGGVAVRGPVHLVLHGLEEALAGVRRCVVVNTGGVDVQHLAPEHPLRAADVADARQQFFEVAIVRAALEAFVIHGEALDQIFGQPLAGPLAELGAARGAHPVAHGQDGGQVVVVHQPAHLARAFGLNNSEFPNGSFRFEFSLVEGVGQVFVDRGDGHLIQLGDLPLRQPHVVAFQPHLYPGVRVGVAVQQQFRLRRGAVVLRAHGATRR